MIVVSGLTLFRRVQHMYNGYMIQERLGQYLSSACLTLSKAGSCQNLPIYMVLVFGRSP